MKIRILFSLIIATFISSSALHAQDYWAGGTGGTAAVWDTTSPNWINWAIDGSNRAFNTGDPVQFEYSYAPQTVTIASNVTTSTVKFAGTGYTITGGTLSFTDGNWPEIDTYTTGTNTIASFIQSSVVNSAQSGYLWYYGTGQLILAGGGNLNGVNFQNSGQSLSLSSGNYTIGNNFNISDNTTVTFTIGSGVMLNVGGTLALIHWDPTANGGLGANVANNDTLNFATLGTLSGDYVFASYGSLFNGVGFANVTNLPSGYTLNYNYNGLNEIALVQSVPEPSTWAMMLGGLGMLTMFRRRA
jgi:hypothetical protein